MDARALEGFKALMASGARHPMLEFYEARLEEAKDNLVSCTVENFQQYQGRVLEIKDVIKIIKQAR